MMAYFFMHVWMMDIVVMRVGGKVLAVLAMCGMPLGVCLSGGVVLVCVMRMYTSRSVCVCVFVEPRSCGC